MDEKELETMIADAIEPRLKEQFMLGVTTGWEACLNTIDELTKDLHNAKKIRAVIKDKQREAAERRELAKSKIE